MIVTFSCDVCGKEANAEVPNQQVENNERLRTAKECPICGGETIWKTERLNDGRWVDIEVT